PRPTPAHSPLTILHTAPATPAPHTLSLHDALPICARTRSRMAIKPVPSSPFLRLGARPTPSSSTSRRSSPSIAVSATRTWRAPRSEEHTSELQSRGHLVCRLLLEKKKKHLRQRNHV